MRCLCRADVKMAVHGHLLKLRRPCAVTAIRCACQAELLADSFQQSFGGTSQVLVVLLSAEPSACLVLVSSHIGPAGHPDHGHSRCKAGFV